MTQVMTLAQDAKDHVTEFARGAGDVAGAAVITAVGIAGAAAGITVIAAVGATGVVAAVGALAGAGSGAVGAGAAAAVAGTATGLATAVGTVWASGMTTSYTGGEAHSPRPLSRIFGMAVAGAAIVGAGYATGGLAYDAVRKTEAEPAAQNAHAASTFNDTVKCLVPDVIDAMEYINRGRQNGICAP